MHNLRGLACPKLDLSPAVAWHPHRLHLMMPSPGLLLFKEAGYLAYSGITLLLFHIFEKYKHIGLVQGYLHASGIVSKGKVACVHF